MRLRGILVAGGLCASLGLPNLAAGQGLRLGAHDLPSVVAMTDAAYHDVSRPLRDITPVTDAGSARQIPLHPLREAGTRAPVSDAADTALQTAPAPLVAARVITGFLGVGRGFRGYTVNSAPPDTNGAVGATQYVQWVNTSFAVFDKATRAVLLGPVPGNTLWSGFGGPCQTNNDGDAIAQYDKAANRWVLTQFSVSSGPPFYQCVAVSTTSDATGAYNRYAFTYANFNDYPKLGIWPDAYYISFNMFNPAGTSFLGTQVCAYDRTKMLAGLAATQQCVQGTPTNTPNGLLPSDLDGATPPPTGSPAFFLGLVTPGVATSGNTLNLWKFHVDWTAPANSSFTGPTSIPVAPYSLACGSSGTCVPQAGTTQQLDSLGDRLMYRLAYRNFGDHESLVVNHSVQIASNRIGIRWYEIRNPNVAPVVFQQGTFSPDATSRWMGSIAMDKVGNMLLGYSTSSTSLHPGIRYTGRLASDALNTLQAEASILQGGGSQQGQNLSRWGDYTAMSVDPVDNCSMWFTNEFLISSGAFNWSTAVLKIRFPNCQ